MTDPAHATDRALLALLLTKTQASVDTVAACFDAGLVDDLHHALSSELDSRGIVLSEQWIEATAERIRRHEPPVLPSADELLAD